MKLKFLKSHVKHLYELAWLCDECCSKTYTINFIVMNNSLNLALTRNFQKKNPPSLQPRIAIGLIKLQSTMFAIAV